ncbi:MAG: hypothetical protein ABI051_06060 [Vicinamibacterales bacterium]
MRQARAVLHPEAIQFAHVFTAEILEEVPAHQLVAQRHEDPLLHLLAADGQAIGARAARACAEARQYMTYPPPHSAHFVRPEKRYFGRRARLNCLGLPFDDARRISSCRAFT